MKPLFLALWSLLLVPVQSHETGELYLISQPGVEVFINNKLIGETNEKGKFNNKSIPVGEQVLKVVKEGYIPFLTKIDIIKNERTDVLVLTFQKKESETLEEEKQEKLPKEEFVIVDEMPIMKGGQRRLQRKIKYPKQAKKLKIEGRVLLKFTVNEKGRVVNAKVIEGIGGGCDQEALRVLRQTRFVPAKRDGKPVAVEMSLPIFFKL
ncbi:MAG: TonB family protein [Balneola sp.]